MTDVEQGRWVVKCGYDRREHKERCLIRTGQRRACTYLRCFWYAVVDATMMARLISVLVPAQRGAQVSLKGQQDSVMGGERQLAYTRTDAAAACTVKVWQKGGTKYDWETRDRVKQLNLVPKRMKE